ncbi:hypothetical protein C8R45DRAFT_927544 [Mycena sanguinolenta]|nr:hypothetical protein C8R45DRAFT_927544 [Mycena sanguinolenta]
MAGAAESLSVLVAGAGEAGSALVAGAGQAWSVFEVGAGQAVIFLQYTLSFGLLGDSRGSNWGIPFSVEFGSIDRWIRSPPHYQPILPARASVRQLPVCTVCTDSESCRGRDGVVYIVDWGRGGVLWINDGWGRVDKVSDTAGCENCGMVVLTPTQEQQAGRGASQKAACYSAAPASIPKRSNTPLQGVPLVLTPPELPEPPADGPLLKAWKYALGLENDGIRSSPPSPGLGVQI